MGFAEAKGIALLLLSLFALLLAISLLPPSASQPQEEFTLIVLPDTQKYMLDERAGIFETQVEWVLGKEDELNIAFVSHEGDIVEHWDSEKEWETASSIFSLLDGVVPYAVLPGNHDMSVDRNASYYNRFFPVSRFSLYPWHGGSYPAGKNNNNFETFSAGGHSFLIIHLEMCPTQQALQWANSVLEAHPERKAIITTHGFLGAEGERNVHAGGYGGCRGKENTQYIWESLVYPNPNVFLVLCGHVHSEARRSDPNAYGKQVHQLLADYQGRQNGGNGWLRVLRFSPQQKKIFVQTYSPYLGKHERDGDSQFSLDANWLAG